MPSSFDRQNPGTAPAVPLRKACSTPTRSGTPEHTFLALVPLEAFSSRVYYCQISPYDVLRAWLVGCATLTALRSSHA